MRTSEAGLYKAGWTQYGYHIMRDRGSGVESLPGVGTRESLGEKS